MCSFGANMKHPALSTILKEHLIFCQKLVKYAFHCTECKNTSSWGVLKIDPLADVPNIEVKFCYIFKEIIARITSDGWRQCNIRIFILINCFLACFVFIGGRAIALLCTFKTKNIKPNIRCSRLEVTLSNATLTLQADN